MDKRVSKAKLESGGGAKQSYGDKPTKSGTYGSAGHTSEGYNKYQGTTSKPAKHTFKAE